MVIDPTLAGLVGVAVGGIIGVFGTVFTAWTASRRERKAFERAASREHADRVRATYEHALNVFFNLHGGGHPDRATYGNVFAQISLFGSKAVNEILNAYLSTKPGDRSIDLPGLIAAMKDHISELGV